MAKPGRASQEKRQRERDRKDRKDQKRADRAIRREEKKNREPGNTDGDPDLVGIFPGPQPKSDEAEEFSAYV